MVNHETGFVIDYAVLKGIVEREIIEKLDHQHLGQFDLVAEGTTQGYKVPEILGARFYPSSENLTHRIVEILYPILEKETKNSVHLSEVTIFETCTSSCTWRR